jgi:DNA-binding protein YbaB
MGPVADLSDVERMVDDWERGAVGKSQRYAAMQHEVERISITKSVAGGAVSVTVGHNGLPLDAAMTDAVRRMSPDEIAANVLLAMRKAQSRYPERLAETVAGTVGDDSASRHIIATAVDNGVKGGCGSTAASARSASGSRSSRWWSFRSAHWRSTACPG